MTCAQIEVKLTPYLLGDLDPADRVAVEQHLADCSGCRAAADELRPTVWVLRQAMAARSGGTLRLDAAHRNRVLASRGRRKPRMAIVWPVLLRAAAVVVIVFMFAGLLMPAMSLSREKARIASAKAREREVALATDLYEVDHGRKPQTANDLRGYLSHGAPVTDAEVRQVAGNAPAEVQAEADSRSLLEPRSRPVAFGGPMMDVPRPRSTLGRLGGLVAKLGGQAKSETAAEQSVALPASKSDAYYDVALPAKPGSLQAARVSGVKVHGVAGVGDGLADRSAHDAVTEAAPAGETSQGREITALGLASAGDGAAADRSGNLTPTSVVKFKRKLKRPAPDQGNVVAEPPSVAQARFHAPDLDGDRRSDSSRRASGANQAGEDRTFGYAAPAEAGGLVAAVPREESRKENEASTPVVMDWLQASDDDAKDGRIVNGLAVSKLAADRDESRVKEREVSKTLADRPVGSGGKGSEREEGEITRLAAASDLRVQASSSLKEEDVSPSDDTLQRLKKIVVPQIEFRQANLHDIVDFLNKVCVDAGAPTPNQPGKDRMFVLNLGDTAKKAGETAALSQDTVKTEATVPEITFNARQISLLNALKIVTSVAGLKYRIVDGTVMIEPHGYATEEIKPVVAPPPAVEVPEPLVETPYPPQVFNPIVETKQNEFSTFGIDVDTASFTLARRCLLQGKRPPEGAVRVEEFVNAFDYAYRPPERDTFAVYADRTRSPFRPSLDVLRIGVRGKVIGRDRMRPSVLTLVIDTSGSMNTPDRLDLIRKSLVMLVDHLGPQDTVAVVAFGSEARLVLEPTPMARKDDIRAAINGLQTYGSTHLEAGLRLGYEVAARSFRSGALNRVLLMSDGVANLGAATAEGILAQVEQFKNQGIYCSVFGVGQGTYNDTMLETLADKGDGVYRFVDSPVEAKRAFVDDLAATLCVIAKDVKIQVQFDPARVTRYRQIGYENRRLEKEQFRDDTVDAGEVGAGQSATALYEIQVTGNPAEPLGTVRLRWKDPETGRVEERAVPLKADDRYSAFDQAPVRFRLAAGVAEFADLLRRNPNTAGATVRDVAGVLRPVGLELSLDPQVQDLVRMVNAVRE